MSFLRGICLSYFLYIVDRDALKITATTQPAVSNRPSRSPSGKHLRLRGLLSLVLVRERAAPYHSHSEAGQLSTFHSYLPSNAVRIPTKLRSEEHTSELQSLRH